MRSFLSAALATSFVAAQAQSPYRPFPEANAGWVETHTTLELFGPNGQYIQFYHYTIESGTDTVINDTVYHELRIREFWEPSWFPAERTFCWFRQDTVERKVFVFVSWIQHSVLWYDFSLPIGPYPETWGHENGDGVHVVSLDSLELNDGWHRSWVLGYVGNDSIVYDSAFCTVIEGVGSNFGLFPIGGLVSPFEWTDTLDCHSVNGSAIYPLGATECDLTMASPALSLKTTGTRVIPNPAQAFICLEHSGSPIIGAGYRIHDQAGRVVMVGLLNSGTDRPRLGVSTLDTGLYTVRCEAPGQAPWTARLIKE